MEAIYRLSQGVAWQRAGEKLFGGGSFGNGSAMRVAPVGVLYAPKLEELFAVAGNTARITHTHPLGLGGAVLQAHAVSLAFLSEPQSPLDVIGFLDKLGRRIQPEWDAFRHKLVHVRELLGREPDLEEVVHLLGNDSTCQGSVPTAIFCFLLHPDSFRDSVVTAVNLGGDTDTIGAMTGAISGARLGYRAIPAEWRDGLENGQSGRDDVIELGRRLFRLYQARSGESSG
jgi:poly(ADP-ribose) glycohydrolase ARH3